MTLSKVNGARSVDLVSQFIASASDAWACRKAAKRVRPGLRHHE